MALSGALTLTDLNDFITPSQLCIKPVETTNGMTPAKEAGSAVTEIRIDSSGSYYEVSPSQSQKKLEHAQISLNDCLACSGCITSAESVLITLQSHIEVLSFLASNEGKALPVISIAPQSLASLATSLSASNAYTPITPHQILQRVRRFCKVVLGFKYVFDTTFARHISLKEHVKEFEERRSREAAKGNLGVGNQIEGHLPMLASSCPGWICYAEKAHPEILPFISRTKSPQQAMGTLVKRWLGERWERKPNEIYHVTVMPCYDKKLEASREDFFDNIYSTRDVDCVITTGELDLMMRDKGWDLSASVEEENMLEDEDVIFPELLQHPGSSSGSYLQTIIDHITQTWPTCLELTTRTIRNTDFEEYTLQEAEGGNVIFRGAKCYGFKNLQNVVRKVGKEKGVRVGSGAAGKLSGRAVVRRERKGVRSNSEGDRGYDYVEVMACPGGCVNGGGQLKPPSDVDGEGHESERKESGGGEQAKWGNREWSRRVEETYWRSGTRKDAYRPPIPPMTPPSEADILALAILGQGLNFRTNYRAVESDVIGLAVKW
ncbi:hypothetical protein AMATHDRAFT_58875 [Amanita thiersii Skay4041]|uniref:Cytosolic Fe-S cluster assembly factor NAR1 n=1 Tax=Amanita thiersii Skay4041 TaxID=703135 RepID=A0A2A9NUN1_9AGAR|nr:hypothetical protein AMATHDRAFT_58875 [Amanita thiersii Skay4041]